MFSRTIKTDYKLNLDDFKNGDNNYHNEDVLYFPSAKHLFIYERLYYRYRKKALEKYTEDTKQFYTTIQTNTTREYNKIFKSDYATNSDYIKYSNLYDVIQTYAKKDYEAFNEMKNSACNKLYETIRTNTKTLIIKCDAYLARLFYIQKQIENNKHKRTNEEETDHKQTYIEIPTYKSIVDDLDTRFYTYNAPRNMKLLQNPCKYRCVNKLNKYLNLLADFIKIVYDKVVVYNKQFKLAIEMVLKSKIYNFGLGLKLSMRDCGLKLTNS